MSPKPRKISPTLSYWMRRVAPDHAMVTFLLASGQERREVGRKLLESYPEAGLNVRVLETLSQPPRVSLLTRLAGILHRDLAGNVSLFTMMSTPQLGQH